MFLAETNRMRQLLHLSFVGVVSPSDLSHSVEEVRFLLADMKPGFVLLTDLSRLVTMDLACEAQIGRLMDVCRERGVGRIILNSAVGGEFSCGCTADFRRARHGQHPGFQLRRSCRQPRANPLVAGS